MTVNITAETLTVVVQATPDWTGPVVGILGVVLGSLMGLSGIRWQHDAQKAYDVRKQCADLISTGENVRNSYLENRNGMVVSEIPAYLEGLAAKIDQMDRIRRHLELIASKKTEERGKAYSEATEKYHEMALLHYKFKNKPTNDDLRYASAGWSAARSKLIAELNPRHSGPQGRFGALSSGFSSWFRRLRKTLDLRKP